MREGESKSNQALSHATSWSVTEASLTESDALTQPAAMNGLSRYTDPVYCIMRFIVGLLLACHGCQLVLGMFGGMPGSDKMITQVGGWIQLIGGLLIAFGLLTRLAAFICSGMFAVAYFMMHVAAAATPTAKLIPIASAGPQYSNHGELAVIYCWIFFFMVFYGAGFWSIDALISRNRPSTIDERNRVAL